MNKKVVNVFLSSVVAILMVAAGFTYYLKEEVREEYEHIMADYEARLDLPIEISYREALLGTGLVAIFKNTSDRHLAIVATLHNPTMKKEENYRLDIAPKTVKEVGHSEGWVFSSGDIIKLVHNDYKVVIVKLP